MDNDNNSEEIQLVNQIADMEKTIINIIGKTLKYMCC